MQFPNIFKIIAKPNSPKSEVKCYDAGRQAYLINIKAKPEGNKANIEIIKFLSKLTGRKARIVNGFKSKEKLIKIE